MNVFNLFILIFLQIETNNKLKMPEILKPTFDRIFSNNTLNNLQNVKGKQNAKETLFKP